MFVWQNTETTVTYRSGYKQNRKNQVNLLMITDGNDWHYLVVSSLSALLEGKLSNLHGYFYCLNSYTTKNRLKERDRNAAA